MLVHAPVKLRFAETEMAAGEASHASGSTKYLVAHPLLMYDFTLQTIRQLATSIRNALYIARRDYKLVFVVMKRMYVSV